MTGHWTGLWAFLVGFALLFGFPEYQRLRVRRDDVRPTAPARRRGTLAAVVAGGGGALVLLVFAVGDIRDASGMGLAIVPVLAGLASCYLVSWVLDRVMAPSPPAVVEATVERAPMLVPMLQVGASLLAGTAVAMVIKLAWLS